MLALFVPKYYVKKQRIKLLIRPTHFNTYLNISYVSKYSGPITYHMNDQLQKKGQRLGVRYQSSP